MGAKESANFGHDLAHVVKTKFSSLIAGLAAHLVGAGCCGLLQERLDAIQTLDYAIHARGER